MFRNCVNCECKICWVKYYEVKVSYLRECKLFVWWKEVKKFSGMLFVLEMWDDISKLL